MPIFTYIPMSVIASILITSSCRLVPKTIMAQLWMTDKFEFWLLIITWLICVFQDGAVGLLIGGFVSFAKLKIEKHMSEKIRVAGFEITDAEVNLNGEKKKFMNVDVKEPLNYINIESFETGVLDCMLDRDPDYVTVNLSNANYVDVDGIIALEKIFKRKKGAVGLILAQQDEQSTLFKSWWFQTTLNQGLVFATVGVA